MTDGTLSSPDMQSTGWAETGFRARAPEEDYGQQTRTASSYEWAFRAGSSLAMRQVVEQIRNFAQSDQPVLISGENGAGHQLAARAIHHHSARGSGPFVTVDCTKVSASARADELLGREDGRLAGENVSTQGQIEAAQKGTLFLDGIDSLPGALQAELLRLLIHGQVLRVGGRHPVGVDVRVIAAITLPPKDALVAGRFSEDLYRRLSALAMTLPPLRDCRSGIGILANSFVRDLALQSGRPVPRISEPASRAIDAHSWPGNISELMAVLQRAVALTDFGEIQLDDLRLGVAPSATPPSRQQAARPLPGTDAERDLLLGTLHRNGLNVSRAARELSVSRVTLYRMMHRNRLMLRQQYVVRGDHDGTSRGE